MFEKLLERLTEEDKDIILGLFFALDTIRDFSGHGSIYMNVVDGKLAELDMENRVRPAISAPWRPKKRE